jgi:hypothetical protein
VKKYIGLILSIVSASSLIWGMQLSKQSIQKKQKNRTDVAESEISRIRSIKISDNGTFIAFCSQTLCSCNRELQVICMSSDTCTFRKSLPRFSGDNDPTNFPDKVQIFLRDDGRQVGISYDNNTYLYDALFNRKIFELKLRNGSYTRVTQNKSMLALAVEGLNWEPKVITYYFKIN